VPMSGHSAVAEVDVVATTRRRWSAAERRIILAEADADGAVVSEVARRHGVSASLLFRWRRLRKEAKSIRRSEPTFVPLALPAPAIVPNATTSVPIGDDGRIEIVLGGGCRIIVGKDVDTAALRRIVDVLERR
jgi:transposase